MHAEERQQAILRRVREGGSIRVTDFAAELGVSPVTMRKDVEVLAERGLVARVHGGAMLPEDWAETAPAASAVPAQGGRPRAMGLIVPSASYYYPEVIKGAREAAAARGVRLTLGVSEYHGEVEQAQARQMIEDGAEGLLLVPSETAGAAGRAWYEELDVPVVLIERRPEHDVAGAEHVGTDHAYGARLAVQHLLGMGRRRVALLIRSSTPTSPWIREGYSGGLRAAGLDGPDAATVIDLPGESPADPDHGRRMEEFLDAVEDGRIDAAIVHPDNEALVLLRRLRARSLSVPGDVALVSYDDEVAALADIPLSAVAPSKHEVGAAAVELLALRLAEPGRPRRRVAILPELRVRSSSTS
ncbi:substrate-binding domain-containing protein [Streptomyces pathocidini]|uniref:Substrate-binding domain-containing protein n=1 Tax=Streptomyces pathocidini TaxID=1650571 RepID=A0ABW7UL11_9ACTN|nr:substrate-binding domain-containing protein [Streptomyces pathocidini]